MATATLTNYNRIAYDSLSSFEESILSEVKTAAVKNLDETGFRVAGKTQWLHVASTKTATYYHVSPKRKSLLDGLSGTVIHDHWKSYTQDTSNCEILCDSSFSFSKHLKVSNSQPYCEFSNVLRMEKSIA